MCVAGTEPAPRPRCALWYSFSRMDPLAPDRGKRRGLPVARCGPERPPRREMLVADPAHRHHRVRRSRHFNRLTFSPQLGHHRSSTTRRLGSGTKDLVTRSKAAVSGRRSAKRGIERSPGDRSGTGANGVGDAFMFGPRRPACGRPRRSRKRSMLGSIGRPSGPGRSRSGPAPDDQVTGLHRRLVVGRLSVVGGLSHRTCLPAGERSRCRGRELASVTPTNAMTSAIRTVLSGSCLGLVRVAVAHCDRSEAAQTGVGKRGHTEDGPLRHVAAADETGGRPCRRLPVLSPGEPLSSRAAGASLSALETQIHIHEHLGTEWSAERRTQRPLASSLDAALPQ